MSLKIIPSLFLYIIFIISLKLKFIILLKVLTADCWKVKNEPQSKIKYYVIGTIQYLHKVSRLQIFGFY